MHATSDTELEATNCGVLDNEDPKVIRQEYPVLYSLNIFFATEHYTRGGRSLYNLIYLTITDDRTKHVLNNTSSYECKRNAPLVACQGQQNENAKMQTSHLSVLLIGTLKNSH